MEMIVEAKKNLQQIVILRYPIAIVMDFEGKPINSANLASAIIEKLAESEKPIIALPNTIKENGEFVWEISVLDSTLEKEL